MNFKDFCKSKGLELLRDDFLFIRKCIAYVPQSERPYVMRKYVDEWLDALEDEENIHGKQSVGRNRANSWLRTSVQDDLNRSNT